MKKVIAVVVILIVVGVGFDVYRRYFQKPRENIQNFEDCIKAGNPVMESFPAKCRTADGREFVQVLPPDGNGTPPEDLNQPGFEAVRKVKARVAEQDGSRVEDVVIVEVVERTWPDGCLGLPAVGESCIAVVTPGYRVKAQVRGMDYVYRTDQTGAVMRME